MPNVKREAACRRLVMHRTANHEVRTSASRQSYEKGSVFAPEPRPPRVVMVSSVSSIGMPLERV